MKLNVGAGKVIDSSSLIKKKNLAETFKWSEKWK